MTRGKLPGVSTAGKMVQEPRSVPSLDRWELHWVELSYLVVGPERGCRQPCIQLETTLSYLVCMGLQASSCLLLAA